MYFCIATAVVLLTIVSYWLLLRTDLGKERLAIQEPLLGQEQKPKMTFSQVFKNVARISKVCKWQALALIIDFWITLAVFPAVQQQGVSQCSDSSVETSEWYCENIATSELFTLRFGCMDMTRSLRNCATFLKNVITSQPFPPSLLLPLLQRLRLAGPLPLRPLPNLQKRKSKSPQYFHFNPTSMGHSILLYQKIKLCWPWFSRHRCRLRYKFCHIRYNQRLRFWSSFYVRAYDDGI